MTNLIIEAVFLSTPSARRATTLLLAAVEEPDISIHALREEGDAEMLFEIERKEYFYPRPPRGGRPIWVLSRLDSREISIHALREEGDLDSLVERAVQE